MLEFIEDTILDIFNSGGTPNDIKELFECIILHNDSLEKAFDLDFEFNPTEMGLKLVSINLDKDNLLRIKLKTEFPEREFSKRFPINIIYDNIIKYFGLKC